MTSLWARIVSSRAVLGRPVLDGGVLFRRYLSSQLTVKDESGRRLKMRSDGVVVESSRGKPVGRRRKESGYSKFFSLQSLANWMVGTTKEEVQKSWIAKILGFNSASTKRRMAAIKSWESILEICEGEDILDMLRIPEEERDGFMVWFELISIHTWLLVRRASVGSKLDKKICEGVVEEFWREAEVKLYEEEGMPYMQISKLMKDLQRTWYARSLLLDEAIEKKDFESMDAILMRNMNCLEGDNTRTMRLRQYIVDELNRLQTVSNEDVLEGKFWHTNYLARQSRRNASLLQPAQEAKTVTA